MENVEKDSGENETVSKEESVAISVVMADVKNEDQEAEKKEEDGEKLAEKMEEQKLDDVEKIKEKKIDDVQIMKEDKIDDVETMKEEKIDDVETMNEEKIDNAEKMKEENIDNVEEMKEENIDNVEEMKEEHIDDVESMNEEKIEHVEESPPKDEVTSLVSEEVESADETINSLKESLENMKKENRQLRDEKDIVSCEEKKLRSLVDRRNEQIDCLHLEISSLGSQLEAAVHAKNTAIADSEKNQAWEMSLNFKEMKLNKEKQIQDEKVAGLEEQLEKRSKELLDERRDATNRLLDRDEQIQELTYRLEICDVQLLEITEEKTSLQNQCEELRQMSEEQRSKEASLYSSYQQEIAAQVKLADLYKKAAEAVNEKQQDFVSAIKQLESKLQSALESNENLKEKSSELFNISRQEKETARIKIAQLTKELTRANDLLEIVDSVHMDGKIMSSTPKSKISNDIGANEKLSMTQLYSQYVDVRDSLTLTCQENKELKSNMQAILKELQHNAPVIQKNGKDLEETLIEVKKLEESVEQLQNENGKLKKSVNDMSKLYENSKSEHHNLKLVNSNLANQVCHLLRLVTGRRNGNGDGTSTLKETPVGDAKQQHGDTVSKFVSEISTFGNVEELQKRNQQLLSTTQQLIELIQELQKEAEERSSKSEVEADADAKIKELAKQRDMYKSMCEKNEAQAGTSDQATEQEHEREIDELNKLLSDSQADLARASSEVDNLKKQLVMREQFLNSENTRLRQEVEKFKMLCCKFKSQTETATEQLQLAQENMTNSESSAKTWKDKCKAIELSLDKCKREMANQEMATVELRRHASSCDMRLAEVERERQALRERENQLLREREGWERERHRQDLLINEVTIIKEQIELARGDSQESETRRLDEATRECAALRRRLHEEQQRSQEMFEELEQLRASSNYGNGNNRDQDNLTLELEKAEKDNASLSRQLMEMRSEKEKRIEEQSEHLRELEELKTRLSQSLTRVENLEKGSMDLQGQLESFALEKNEHESRLNEAFQREFQQLQAERDCISIELKLAQEAAKEAEENYAKVQERQSTDLESMERYRNEAESAKKKLAAAEKETCLSCKNTYAELDKLKVTQASDIQQLKVELSESWEVNEESNRKIGSLNNKLQEAKNKLQEMTSKELHMTKVSQNYKSQLDECRKKSEQDARQANEQIKQLTERIKELEEELASLRKKNLSPSSLALENKNLSEQLNDYKKRIAEFIHSSSPTKQAADTDSPPEALSNKRPRDLEDEPPAGQFTAKISHLESPTSEETKSPILFERKITMTPLLGESCEKKGNASAQVQEVDPMDSEDTVSKELSVKTTPTHPVDTVEETMDSELSETVETKELVEEGTTSSSESAKVEEGTNPSERVKRKSKIDQLGKRMRVESSPSVTLRQRRASTTSLSPTPAASSTIIQKTPKPGRGRPKKIVETTPKSPIPVTPKSLKKPKRGRPKLSKN